MAIWRSARTPVVVDRTAVVDDGSTVIRQPWSPAQAVALAIGFLFTILGAVALARTGLSFGDPGAQHVGVAGFHHTALLGLVELITGLCLIGAGVVPGAGRGSMTFFGVLLLGFGLVVAIEPDTFHRVLATHGAHGALYAVMGTVLMLAAMLAPVFIDRRRRIVDVRDVGVVEDRTRILR